MGWWWCVWVGGGGGGDMHTRCQLAGLATRNDWSALVSPPNTNLHGRQDLPPGSLEYNDWALQLKVEPAQRSDEVDAIIHEARAPPPLWLAPYSVSV